MSKPEGVIENYLRNQCRKHNYLCYKFVSPGRIGVPDRIVIANGQVIFVELKSETGKLSKVQEVCINEMKLKGADVRIFNSKHMIDDFMQELDCNIHTRKEMTQNG